jgi:predicted MFS family arabinose efflux permease
MRPALFGLPRIYWVLWAGQLINRLGSFALPFLPLYLVDRLHYTDAGAGDVFALFGLGNLLGAPLGGWAGDRFGRRRALLTALPLNVAALVGLVVAPAGAPLAAVAFALGASNGYGPVLTAAVSDVVAPADRARAFGYLYWAVNLGVAAACVLGGALARVGFHWLFLGDALTTAALVAIVYLRVPETRPALDEGRARPPLSAAFQALGDPRLAGFALAQLATLVVFLQSFVLMPLQERARGISTGAIGLVTALNGVVIIVAQPAVARFARAQPAWRMLALGAALTGAAAVGISNARTVGAFAACMVVVSLGEVAFSAAAPTYVASIAPADRRASYQGAYSLCWAAASLLGPLLGPRAAARFGDATAWRLGAAVCAVAAVLHATVTRRAEASPGLNLTPS